MSDNKRIAKNTLFLYFRMFLIMGVALYTSRIVLRTLGVEDYGLYNVVGGIVTMFSFINSNMQSYQLHADAKLSVIAFVSNSRWVRMCSAPNAPVMAAPAVAFPVLLLDAV